MSKKKKRNVEQKAKGNIEENVECVVESVQKDIDVELEAIKNETDRVLGEVSTELDKKCTVSKRKAAMCVLAVFALAMAVNIGITQYRVGNIQESYADTVEKAGKCSLVVMAEKGKEFSYDIPQEVDAVGTAASNGVIMSNKDRKDGHVRVSGTLKSTEEKLKLGDLTVIVKDSTAIEEKM